MLLLATYRMSVSMEKIGFEVDGVGGFLKESEINSLRTLYNLDRSRRRSIPLSIIFNPIKKNEGHLGPKKFCQPLCIHISLPSLAMPKWLDDTRQDTSVKWYGKGKRDSLSSKSLGLREGRFFLQRSVSFLHKWTIFKVCAGLGGLTYKISLWFKAPYREMVLSIFLLWHLFFCSASILPSGQEVLNNWHSHWKLLFCWAIVCVSVVSTYWFCVLQLEHHRAHGLHGHKSLMMGKDSPIHGPWMFFFTQLDTLFFSPGMKRQ